MSRTRRTLLWVLVLALGLIPSASIPARPDFKADPMLHRFLRAKGLGIDAAGNAKPIDTAELERYSRFLAIEPHANPPTARLRMRLDDSARITLERMGLQVYGRMQGFASVVVPIARIPELANIAGIEYMQIGRVPKPELEVSVPAIRADQVGTVYGSRAQGVLIGDVDTGVDWHHADFRNPDGTTRIKFLWDQTVSCPVGVGTLPPVPFNFGCQYTEADINAALLGGASPTFTDPQAHGTHVLGIAGGNGLGTGNAQPAGTYVGVGSKANLIMIKIFPDFVGGCTQCYDIGLGLDMIDAKAAEFGLPYSVNLSVGSDLGAHDGSDADEMTIDALTGPGKPGKVISKSAGNSRGVGIHMSGTVATGGTNNHTFNIPAYTPAPETGDDVVAWEMWYKGADRMTVTLLDPATSPCTSTVTVSGSTGGGNHGVGTASGTMIIDDTGTPGPNGDNFFEGEVDDQLGPTPCRGTWTWRVHGDTITAGGHYDIWIWYSSIGVNQLQIIWNSPDLTNLISIPGTAFNTTAVGAHVTKNNWFDIDGNHWQYSGAPPVGSLASFSSPGPTRDGRIKPDISAPGMGISSTLSIDAAPAILADTTGLREQVMKDGVHWLIQGTSMSTPHVAGVYGELLALNPTLDAIQLRTLVTTSAVKDSFTGATTNNDWGAGKLDALAAAANLVKDIPTVAGGTDSATFTWTGITQATTYNVYRGDTSLLNGTFYGNCFLHGLPTPNFTDASTPIPGHANFYLVTGSKDGVEGLLGFKTNGTPMPNGAPCGP